MKPVLNHLEKVIAFKTIAECKSLHKAAIKLHVSQPSLSAMVKTLEDQLNKKLFNRSHKGVVLTSHGQTLLHFADKILTEYEAFESHWDQLSLEPTGEITVGLFDSIAVYFWPQFYKTFSKKYPKVTINLMMGRSAELMKCLKDQEVDVTITVNPTEFRGVTNRLLYEDTFAFYISKALIEQLNLEVKADELKLTKDLIKQTDLIIFPEFVASSETAQLNITHIFNLEFAHTLKVASFEAARELCKLGLGIALLPNKVARYSSTKLYHCKITNSQDDGLLNHGIYVSMLDKNANQLNVKKLAEELIHFSNKDF